jgi:acyl-homoserine-lactone acylase
LPDTGAFRQVARVGARGVGPDSPARLDTTNDTHPRARANESMKRLLMTTLLLVGAASCSPGGEAPTGDVDRWEERADRVTIIRDEWGIPHIYAPTDADAIFGLMYAQAEDDFNRIETNFLNSQGRLAEAEGEGEIWRDLRMRLFIDPEEMRALYAESPAWLRDLMDAWADGLNYYLHTHAEVTPRVLTRFEPWMALTFSEGSIGGDIERVSLQQLEAFYSDDPLRMLSTARAASPEPGSQVDARVVASSLAVPDPDVEPTGSNGFAIAPANTENGHALLLINPHTSFFFRHEAHVVSDEGLNVYGALTWGQFFVYQGFNETAGWMHTSSQVDNIDEFLETVVSGDEGLAYLYGDEERPVEQREVTVRYRTDDGMAERVFTVYRTHHGPIVRAVDGRWVSVALMEEPMSALIQSYSRTRAADYDEFVEVMGMHTNSSNNTLFADAEGNIAYFHSNFVPVRDTRFDYDRPVDGSDPATDWQGVHSFDETVNVVNPPNGWVQNTNNWPYSAAGEHSPRPEDFPRYMDRGSENARGLHALMVLEGRTDFTLERLRDAAYDSYLTAFEPLVPALLASYDGLPAGDPRRTSLAEPVAMLRAWDLRWGAESIATAVAVFWGTELMRLARATAREAGVSATDFLTSSSASDTHLDALATALARLETDFGDWRTPWGEINRFQRLTGDIDHPFDDAGPSVPVGFTSAQWGSLASFGAAPRDGSKRWYGTSGNSFVAVVEFGDSVRALAVTAGGLNRDPDSPHFNDQAERYATGDLRPVHFYRSDVDQHAVRVYRPGG